MTSVAWQPTTMIRVITCPECLHGSMPIIIEQKWLDRRSGEEQWRRIVPIELSREDYEARYKSDDNTGITISTKPKGSVHID